MGDAIEMTRSEVSTGHILLHISVCKADVALDAKLPIVSAVSTSTASLYRDSSSRNLENSDSPRCNRPSKTCSGPTGQLAGRAICEEREQSLHGYLRLLAKRPLSPQTDNNTHITSSASSEVQRLAHPPVDTYVQLRELSKLTNCFFAFFERHHPTTTAGTLPRSNCCKTIFSRGSSS